MSKAIFTNQGIADSYPHMPPIMGKFETQKTDYKTQFQTVSQVSPTKKEMLADPASHVIPAMLLT